MGRRRDALFGQSGARCFGVLKWIMTPAGFRTPSAHMKASAAIYQVVEKGHFDFCLVSEIRSPAPENEFLKQEMTFSTTCYSVMVSARLNGHNEYAYFRYLLEKMPLASGVEDIEELLPHNLAPQDIPTP